MAAAMSALRWAGNVLLTMVTVLFLASMGGGMIYVWWILVPLHWWTAQHAGRVGTWWWAFLAGKSMAIVGMMLTYIAGGNDAAAVVVNVLCFLGTMTAFVVARNRRRTYPASSS
jgi:hypothetical protein